MSVEKGLELVNSVKSVSRETQERLTDYFDLLNQWQQSINLISPGTVDQIWERHMADSMQCSAYVGKIGHLIDIGSGAGFPGLVMAMVMAEGGGGRVDFIESSGKKCAFINAVIRETKLRQAGLEVHVHHGRIEHVLSELPKPDVISARALASLDELLKLTNPHINSGCIGLFPKGKDHEVEIEKAQENWGFAVESQDSKFELGSVLLKISKVNPRQI